MNIFKNYKFYVIIAAIVCIVAVKVLSYFGLGINAELVQDFITYVLSILIAYNVITINVPSSTGDIKKDVIEEMETLQKNIAEQIDEKDNKKDDTQ